jgi:hypothetical protein
MNIPFAEMKISKLINHSMDMCWNGQGTTVPVANLWFEGLQKILSVALNPRSPISHRIGYRSERGLTPTSIGVQASKGWYAGGLWFQLPKGLTWTPTSWQHGLGWLSFSHWQKCIIILLRNQFVFHIFCNLLYSPPSTIWETITSFSSLITSFLC